MLANEDTTLQNVADAEDDQHRSQTSNEEDTRLGRNDDDERAATTPESTQEPVIDTVATECEAIKGAAIPKNAGDEEESETPADNVTTVEELDQHAPKHSSDNRPTPTADAINDEEEMKLEKIEDVNEEKEEEAVNAPPPSSSSSETRSERVLGTSMDDIGVTRSPSEISTAPSTTNRRSSEPASTTAVDNSGHSTANSQQSVDLSSVRLAPQMEALRTPPLAETDIHNMTAAPTTPRSSTAQESSSQQQQQPFRLRMMTSEELLAQLSATASPVTPAWAPSQEGTDSGPHHHIPISVTQSGGLQLGGTTTITTNVPFSRTLLSQTISNVPGIVPRRPTSGSLPVLPPLQPQPVLLPSPEQRRRPTVTVDGDDDDEDDDDDDDHDFDAAAATRANASYSRFRCPICFEFMSDPASCGFCSTRFCWECLCRVAVRLDHAQRSAFGSAKCPTCREIFSMGTIRRDAAMKEEIQHQVVRCPFPECGQVMQLHEMAAHEATCSYCTLKCRFASVGCSWTGRRSELATHETSACVFYPLRQWIEHMRQTSHDHAQQLLRTHEEITALATMIEAMETSEYLVRQQVKCPNNPLHLLEYTVVSLCTTPLLIFYSRDVWRYFHHSEQARGTVYNFLTMLPTQLLLMTVTACGYRLFLKQMNLSSTADWNKEQLDRVVDVFLSFSLTLLWILLLSAMYVDGQSSLDWRVFQAPGFLLDNMMNHVLSLGMLAAHFAIWQFLDSTRVGLLIWGWTLLASTFIPAVVSSISQVMNRSETAWPDRPQMVEIPNPAKFLLTGRAANAVMFGLRYGVLAASIGILPTLDATMVLFAVRDFVPQLVTYHWAYPEINEPLLSWIPQLSPLAHLMVAVRLAMEAWLWINYSSESVLQESLLATVCLLLVNQISLRLIQVGGLLGAAVATTWTSFDQAGAAPERDYSAFGMTVFGMWCFSLAAIAMSANHKL